MRTPPYKSVDSKCFDTREKSLHYLSPRVKDTGKESLLGTHLCRCSPRSDKYPLMLDMTVASISFKRLTIFHHWQNIFLPGREILRPTLEGTIKQNTAHFRMMRKANNGLIENEGSLAVSHLINVLMAVVSWHGDIDHCCIDGTARILPFPISLPVLPAKHLKRINKYTAKGEGEEKY